MGTDSYEMCETLQEHKVGTDSYEMCETLQEHKVGTDTYETLQEHNGSTSHPELLVMSYCGLVKCVEEHLNPL